MINFDSVENRKKWSPSRKIEEIKSDEVKNFEDDFDSEEMSEEDIFSGNITVTIKDKPVIESKEEILEILRKSFEALKINAHEGRRLQELKTKIQEKIATKRLRRFFNAWRNRVKNLKVLEKKKKETRELSNERKIELFINAIVEKQKQLKKIRKSSTSSPLIKAEQQNQRCNSAPEELIDNFVATKNNYPKIIQNGVEKKNSQSRLQIQRKIIEEQRIKLMQQNKIIEEMKLKEIDRETRKAHRETIDATRGTLNLCERGTRRSLISLIKEQVYRNDSVDTLRVPETPDFLLRMEARANARRERNRRSEEARVKRIEEERKKEDEARKKDEIERKRLQNEAQKEAKRLREEREEKRIRDIELIKLNNEKADNFYRNFLLNRYIFQPLHKLLQEKYNFHKKAVNHYNKKLMKNYFSSWKLNIQQQYAIKEELAISIYERNLLLSSFDMWRKFTKIERQKYHVASDFYDLKIQSKCFKLFHKFTIESSVIKKKNEQIADNYLNLKVKEKYFYLWMKFLQISDDIKESDKQKQEWREIIQKVIPDFQPKHQHSNGNED
ncbi:golgin subfamily A member 6-like protein 22 [Leptopilina heterotoma]|uniref:golgin subfamily A member 6-like protein 22 n=1 Tax=Leptopilina heterotoma TaxID=63436 RepID=UPI001CA9BE33|nr:golgin subfamily A member 6-like protein 22 [Leptopilina heterotoma]XP_043462487.1 golgin subfamily A member 6-like protein 22 [Leptopilina heterotoma]